jgi:homoserine dehydrogenase
VTQDVSPASLRAGARRSTVRIGVLGCGNVGGALVTLVAGQAKEIEARTGVQLEIARVAVRNLSRDRDVELGPGVLTRDAFDVVNDPDIDLVVEVIGGIEPARELITTALHAG